MRVAFLTLSTAALAAYASPKKPNGCPYSDTASAAKFIQSQPKILALCDKLLNYEATKGSTGMPSSFYGCALSFVTDSCAKALNAPSQCYPSAYKNYGSFNNQHNLTAEQPIYTNGKFDCCLACYSQVGCIAYANYPKGMDVNCNLFSSQSNGTSTCYSSDYGQSNPYHAASLSGAGSSPSGDTYEYGPCPN